MVKTRKNSKEKPVKNQEANKKHCRPTKIGANTPFETCVEQLSAFGGVLGFLKFLELVRFNEIFNELFLEPSRKPVIGHYKMVLGIILLLFIGFSRLWHFIYIQFDPILCGALDVQKLPHATTFWRYLNSLGINQAKPLLRIIAAVRERVWAHCSLSFEKIHIDIDTTVETVYGNLQGAMKGHNTSHRGKKGFRPVMAFISQTREFLAGKFRSGKTISAKETAALIRSFPALLPCTVKKVVIRADGEFISYEAVCAALACNYIFIFANRASKPDFDNSKWYSLSKNKHIFYNDCIYQPQGWDKPCRFVVMRIPKEKAEDVSDTEKQQLQLFEDDSYKYRIFATNDKKKSHKIISEYDGRADAENLVGEVKREGLSAIPSAKFKNNYAYFYIFMLAYNIWRWMKLMAEKTISKKEIAEPGNRFNSIGKNTVRIARLVLLLIAAKIVYTSNQLKVRYSIHDSRVSGLFNFMEHIDQHRRVPMVWTQWKPNCQPPKLLAQEKSCAKIKNSSSKNRENDTS